MRLPAMAVWTVGWHVTFLQFCLLVDSVQNRCPLEMPILLSHTMRSSSFRGTSVIQQQHASMAARWSIIAMALVWPLAACMASERRAVDASSLEGKLLFGYQVCTAMADDVSCTPAIRLNTDAAAPSVAPHAVNRVGSTLPVPSPPTATATAAGCIGARACPPMQACAPSTSGRR